MKTLADFKRDLKTHKNWTFSWNCDDQSCPEQQRKVASVHGSHVWFVMPDRNNRESCLTFPKAAHCWFPSPNTMVVQGDDDPLGHSMTYRKIFDQVGATDEPTIQAYATGI